MIAEVLRRLRMCLPGVLIFLVLVVIATFAVAAVVDAVTATVDPLYG